MPKLATDARVRAARLDAHGLRDGLPSVAAAVTRLGAVQAQDFTAAKWVIGARVPGSVAADVDAAVASREIVRSWPMRGTLHLLPTPSLRPILSITGPRELQRAATRHRQLELDDAVYRAARAIAETELADGASRSRDELQAAWNAAGIETAGQRGYHLIWWLANDAVVCWGPTEARGQRLVLLDEWAPGTASHTDRDETLAAMFVAYVTGHGPVTVRDFAWWSGLTLSDARVGLLAAGDSVTRFDDERFVAAGAGWPADTDSDTPRLRSRLALAAFDEYVLGYADRTAVCDPVHAARVVPGANGVFQPILVSSGRVVGTWKRTPRRGAQAITLAGFDATSAIERSAYRRALGEWARFWALELGEITAQA